jgi:hypothetical protein
MGVIGSSAVTAAATLPARQMSWIGQAESGFGDKVLFQDPASRKRRLGLQQVR